MTRILIAEDDRDIRMGLVDILHSEGYESVEVDNGQDALEQGVAGGFDLIILDVMMPGASGYDVCESIRRQDALTPIMMLTARGAEIDKVVGLRCGADDYITKPFGIHELLARVHALLRRSRIQKPSGPSDAPFQFGVHDVDPPSLRLKMGTQIQNITPRELKLLRLFHDHPGQVLSRSFLLEQAWGVSYEGTTRTLDQHIAQLRKKIEQTPSQPCFITTVHGAGYRYVPARD